MEDVRIHLVAWTVRYERKVSVSWVHRAYESLLNEKVLSGLQEIEGYHCGYVLRQEEKEETEFVVVNFFKSVEAVEAFFGP